MKKAFKMLLSIMLVLSIVLGSFTDIDAAKVKINVKKKTMYVGDSYKLKVTGIKSKVKWSTSKKSVATVKDGTVKARKKGNAVITATVLKKKYTCKITVKNKINKKQSPPPIPTLSQSPPPSQPPIPTPTLDPRTISGSRENPLNAYNAFTSDIYYYSKNLGKFEIQLLEYKQGEEAVNLVMQNPYNTDPLNYEEYIYLKFSIKYLSGTEPIDASDVINYYSNLFNTNSTLSIENKTWGYFDNEIEDMVDVNNMYPGASIICQKAILINKGSTPITYRLQTGYDVNNYDKVYTWFKIY